MTREEIARALGCEVPASIKLLAEDWEGRQDLLGDLLRALPVYGEVRRSVERRIGRVSEDVWQWADELGFVHHVVFYRQSNDSEADVEETTLVDALRVIAQRLEPKRRRRAALGTGDGDDARHGADKLQFGLNEDRLLSPSEHACAQTITDYWAGVMGAASNVSGFRQRAFGSPRRTLGEDAGDQFIASPLVRLCSFRALAAASIHPGAQGARVVRWDKQDERCGNVLKDYQNENWRVAPGLDLTAASVHVYRFAVEVPDSGVSLQETVLCQPNTRLSWIPYIPIDTELYDGDETFPVVLPGSVADGLARCAAYWAGRLPWEVWEIAHFIVTGALRTLRPIQTKIGHTAYGEAQAQKQWTGLGARPESDCPATFARKMRMRSDDAKLRGAVTIVVEPWVSEATVRRCYSRARDIAMGRTDRSRHATHGCSNGRVRIPAEKTLAMVRDATAKALEPGAASGRWLRSILCRGRCDYSNELKAYKRALEILDLDPDPVSLFKSL